MLCRHCGTEHPGESVEIHAVCYSGLLSAQTFDGKPTLQGSYADGPSHHIELKAGKVRILMDAEEAMILASELKLRAERELLLKELDLRTRNAREMRRVLETA